MDDIGNSTPTVSMNSSDTSTTEAFDQAIGVWLPGMFCVLGIVGNVISFAVLSMDRSISPTFLTLKALALSDIILLSAAFFQQVVPISAMRAECIHPLCLQVLPYVHGYLWPVICITQMTSVYFTVLISAERYAAICRPLQTKRLRSLARIRTCIISVTCFSIVFNIPKFFEHSFYSVTDIHPTTNGTLQVVHMEDTTLRKNPVYRYLYNSALYAILMYALPLTVLSILNTSIVRHMRRAHQRWSELNRALQRELKATAVPLCIVIVFVICGTQALITFILDAYYVNPVKRWLQMYTAIANLFIIINSAVNFIIFYLFGSKFRRLMRSALPCCTVCKAFGLPTSSPILIRRFHSSRGLHDLHDISTQNGLDEEGHFAHSTALKSTCT